MNSNRWRSRIDIENLKSEMYAGGLLIDKDAGMTSHDVVARLRRLADQRDIGHTGTLDPLATGLLVCLLGRATKIAPFLTLHDKGYRCGARLGIETDTYDADGRVTAVSDAIPTERSAVERALAGLAGEYDQTPPPYSAVKVAGKRLYKYALRNQQVELPRRRVTIHSLRLTEFNPPHLTFECHVSSGAYVRSLCHDLGRALGCGAHVVSLRRTFAGPLRVEEAARLENLAAAGPGGLAARLMPIAALLPELPCLRATDRAVARLIHGNACGSEDFAPFAPEQTSGRPLLIVSESGEAIALAEAAPLRETPAGRSRAAAPAGRFEIKPTRLLKLPD